MVNYAATYQEHVRRLADQPEAVSQAVGGHFDDFGALMRDILVDSGLQNSDYLIDVGCGSGRLAHMLTVDRYLGTDVVPELLHSARALCPNPAWRFETVSDIVIPEQDATADMVCFFSVFTHLLHEDCFRYLGEARRVLRANGKAIFSFLEFRAGNHWVVFEDMVRARSQGDERPHNQFLDRDAIRLWAQHSGFLVQGFIDGETHTLGQSVCLLAAQ
jgi:SAM-dependent methyltransferase